MLDERMKPVYIMAPLIKGTVVPIKCKAPRHKRAKRNQVPPDYRRDRIKELRTALFYFKKDLERKFKL